MNNINTKPSVLYKYEDIREKDVFSEHFLTEFNVYFCQSDIEAERYIEQSSDICAVFIDHSGNDAALLFPIFKLAKERHPRCLRIVLSNDVDLDTTLSFLEARVITQCYTKPYDSNLIRSNVFMAQIGLKEQTSTLLMQYESNQNPHILIVDDEPTAIKYLVKQLVQMGCAYKILTATNALEALGLIKAHPSEIAVIVTDQRMPGMLGNQLLNEIKQLQPNIIRILTSAYGEINVALGAVNEGRIFNYLKKPWRAKDVLNCINEAVIEHNILSQKCYESQLSFQHQFNDVLSKRRSALERTLAGRIDNISGQGTLKSFLEILESIETSAAKASNIRASHETLLEHTIIDEFTQAIQQRLSSVDWDSSLDTNTIIQVHRDIDHSLSQHIQTNHSQDQLSVAQVLVKELILALKNILSSSGEQLDSLQVSHVNGDMIITNKNPVTLYKHLLSPLTQVSTPLIKQQCSILMLIIICRKLDGAFKTKAGKQCFSFSINLPCKLRI